MAKHQCESRSDIWDSIWTCSRRRLSEIGWSRHTKMVTRHLWEKTNLLAHFPEEYMHLWRWFLNLEFRTHGLESVENPNIKAKKNELHVTQQRMVPFIESLRQLQNQVKKCHCWHSSTDCMASGRTPAEIERNVRCRRTWISVTNRYEMHNPRPQSGQDIPWWSVYFHFYHW